MFAGTPLAKASHMTRCVGDYTGWEFWEVWFIEGRSVGLLFEQWKALEGFWAELYLMKSYFKEKLSGESSYIRLMK